MNKMTNYVASRQSCTMRLLVWMDELNAAFQRQKRLGSATNYLRTRQNFMCFLSQIGEGDIPISRLNAELLAGYQEWLLASGKSRNTLAFHMRNLRSVYNHAIRDGLLPRHLWDTAPFLHVCTSSAPTHKRAADTEVLSSLSKLNIGDGLKSVGKDPARKSFERMVRDVTFARDTFIFCFCACGLPFVDFAYLTDDNIRGGMLCYERHKTGTHIEMEILPQMQQFIDRYATHTPYLFPVLTSRNTEEAYRQYCKALRRYNHRLQLLSKMLDTDINLSTYVARHSWATTVYHNNMPESYIKERMGHTSLQTTRTYLKSFESSKIDDMNRRIINMIIK